MEKKVNKNLNIPNALSFFRMLLIPVFIVFYMMADKTDYIYYVYAASALILSGLTDLFDGVIARKFNQITELGKILDPIADKLTQMAVVVCVAIKLGNLIISLALALFVSMARTLADDSLRGVEDARSLDVPVLALVPRIDARRRA